MRRYARPRPLTVFAMGLVVCAPLAAGWHAAGGDTPRPSVFQSSSYAAAVHLVANPVPTPFVAELGRGDLPQGSSSWDADGSASATASTYFPGLGVTGAGALVCSAGAPCPRGFPPPFPTVATAQYPTAPDASVPTGQHLGDEHGPVEATAVRAVAHAGTDRATTTAAVGGLRLAAAAPAATAALEFRRRAARVLGGATAAGLVRPAATDGDAVRVDTLTATTSQAFDATGALVASAASTLHGVHLLGGAISIQSIVTTSTARVDPTTKLATNDSHTVLGAVTAAGQPARIDEHGITIASTSSVAGGVVQSLNDALRQALDAAGAQVVLLSANKTGSATDAGVASQGSAGGVLYTAKAGDPRIPGPVSAVAGGVQLGQAGSSASASADAIGAVGELATLPLAPAEPPAGGALAPGAGAASPAPSATTPPLDVRGTSTAPSTGPRRVATRRALASIDDRTLVARLRWVYAAMTVTCVVLALGTHASWWKLGRRLRGDT